MSGGQPWLPGAGPMAVPCHQCGLPGELMVEHRHEWVDPPPGGWPPGVAAARLASACRGCGSDFLSVSRRLVASAQVLAAEMPWMTCEQCRREEAAVLWAWLVCGRCGMEDRGEFV